MPTLLLALALASPSAPAPLPTPAPPPLTRAEVAGAYSGMWCGHPIWFRLSADGHYGGWCPSGGWWVGTYSLRGGVVRVREWPSADPGLNLCWWFRPVRDRNRPLRRHGCTCHQGSPPAKKAD